MINNELIRLSLFFLCMVMANVDFAQNAAPKTFKKSDLKGLDWVIGKWKGTDASGKQMFYEHYVMLNDSTIEMRSYDTDSTFTRTTERGSVYLERGKIKHKSGNSFWQAERLTTSEISFKPLVNASNSFTWVRKSTNEWVATLINLYQGKRNEAVYFMRRVR
jgi:hypothetical protein